MDTVQVFAVFATNVLMGMIHKAMRNFLISGFLSLTSFFKI